MPGLVSPPSRIAGGELLAEGHVQKSEQSILGVGLVTLSVQERGLQEQELLDIGVLFSSGLADRQSLGSLT